MEQVITTRYLKGDFITVPNKNAIKPLKATTQAVFMWIASYADDEGICFPSRKTIAKNCGVTVDTVDTHIKKLVDAGLLQKTARKDGKQNKTNIYQILIVTTYQAEKSDGGVAEKTTLGSRKNPVENYTTELNNTYANNSSSPNKEKEDTFDFKKRMDGIFNGDNKDLKVIGLFIRENGMTFENGTLFNNYIKDCRGHINQLTKKYGKTPYHGCTANDIIKAVNVAKARYSVAITFHMVISRLPELLSKK